VNPFSPNNDGYQDKTTVSFTLNTTAEVTMNVRNADNVVIKTLLNKASKSAGTVNAIWDGKDTNGNVVSDGEYKISLGVVNSGGNISNTTTVSVDTSVDPVNPPAAKCSGFTDVLASDADCKYITFVKNEGIMTGNDDGTFAKNDLLQRDQAAKISLETFNLFNGNTDYCGGSAAFPDVLKAQWSYQYVCRGKNLGMITGYQDGVDAGKYLPARTVSRVEAYALIFRNLNDVMPADNQPSYIDVALNQWFTGFAKYAMDHSLFAGSYLYPTDQVTRLEMAQLLYKLDQLNKL